MSILCQYYMILLTGFLSKNIHFPSSFSRICSNMNRTIMFVWMTRKENALLDSYSHFFAKYVLWCCDVEKI